MVTTKKKIEMRNMSNNRREFNSIVLENNILTILDNSWSKHNPLHLHEDRNCFKQNFNNHLNKLLLFCFIILIFFLGAAFLKAVRDASLTPESGIPPTRKIYKAIFDILRNGESLELLVASYQVLIELDKRYPRVYLSKLSSGGTQVVMAKEAWLPFVLSSDAGYRERGGADEESSGSVDSAGFYQLVQDLAEMADMTGSAAFNMKFLGNMLLFQYLVSVLEGDFLPRNAAFLETMDWNLVKESALNLLLGSRKVNYKYLMTDSVSLACTLYSQVRKGFFDPSNNSKDVDEKMSFKCDDDGMAAVEVALLELGQSTCVAIQKLLSVIMELDVSRKKADDDGYITRADGLRIPLMEIIMDQLTYDKNLISSFLQVLSEPNRKLDIVLQYFWKYVTKPSVRTRRSNKPMDDMTFNGVLQCFSNISSIRSITKKIGPEIVQLLLAHAFQAHLSLSFESFSKEGEINSPFKEICKKLTSVFLALRKADEKLKILPFAKESLLVATRILNVDNM